MVNRRAVLPASPLAPGVSPVHIRYREAGEGVPLLILHGGWGYEIYPFDGQVTHLEQHHRIVIPDRTGYGGSGALDAQRPDFHQRAADETLAVMDALAIEQAVLWGHSDGAVIALRLGIAAPSRVLAVIAEATHYFRKKPRSRAFFETMRDAPDDLGGRVVATLRRDHGERWRSLIRTNGEAWLRIADAAISGDDHPDDRNDRHGRHDVNDLNDLYGGQLATLQAPVLILHGARDPRTEPGELAALGAALAGRLAEPREPEPGRSSGLSATLVLEEGGHSPHSERATAGLVTGAASAFLAAVTARAR
jgi:pimeloyl-ACP methyl ester carboxylesterase